MVPAFDGVIEKKDTVKYENHDNCDTLCSQMLNL